MKYEGTFPLRSLELCEQENERQPMGKLVLISESVKIQKPAL